VVPVVVGDVPPLPLLIIVTAAAMIMIITTTAAAMYKVVLLDVEDVELEVAEVIDVVGGI